MRRTTRSWLSTIAKRVFKRSARHPRVSCHRAAGTRPRRLSAEQLEERQVLSADAFFGLTGELLSANLIAGSERVAKISPDLVELSQRYDAYSGAAGVSSANSFEEFVAAFNAHEAELAGSVLVKVTNAQFVGDSIAIRALAADDGALLADELGAVGAIQLKTYDRIVTGLLPASKISLLETIQSLEFVQTVPAPIFTSGVTTTQGDAAQRSDDVRNQLGVDGTGVTVGVVSNSYDSSTTAATNAVNDVASGDLPGTGNAAHPIPVNVLSDGLASDNDEGRAMLQIIHDVAPGATLAFASRGLTVESMADAIRDLRNDADADIIVDNALFLNEPFFMDGVISRAVDDVVADGAIYFSSAGNSASNSYESNFRSSGLFTGSFLSSQGTIRNDLLHDFDPGAAVDVSQLVTLPFGRNLIALQWDDPFRTAAPSSTGALNDFDIFVNGTSITSSFANFGGDAFEIVFLDVTSPGGATINFSIGLNAVNPNGGLRLKYVIGSLDGFGAVINEFATNSPTSVAHKNAAGTIAVGAALYVNTPEFGVSPPMLSSFSSRGGTSILFDDNGNRLAVPEIRQTVDIVAPEGGNNTFFGVDFTVDADSFPNFIGTSASAPHAAAVGALLKDANPGITRQQLVTALQSTAIDMNDPLTPGFDVGYDNATGFGLIDARAALRMTPPNADFDGNGFVDGWDFLTWQRGLGSTPAFHEDGNANFDDKIDGLDLAVWKMQFGTASAPALLLDPDYDDDGNISAYDYVIWQENVGLTSATNADGDANNDGLVNSMDLLGWELGYAAAYPDSFFVPAAAVDSAAALAPGEILVSSLADEIDNDYSLGDLTLREALAIAAQTTGQDTIRFSADLSGGTITLANNLDRLVVTSDVEIRGLGTNQLTINGGGSAFWQGVFLVDTGVTATIRDLKITGGYAMPGPPGTIAPFNGGGVYNRGHLTLNRVLVAGNLSLYGGGIAQETSGASLTIVDSTISDNFGNSPGGGLYASAGSVQIISSTLVNNSTSVYGGGIYLEGTASLSVVNSTLSGNQREAVRVASTTASASFLNSTISNNTHWSSLPANSTAGGVNGSGGTITLTNTIVAANTGGDINGTLNTASHHNLIGDGSEANLLHGTNSNQVGTAAAPVNAQLAPLASNGGATQTHLIQANSPAINAGSNSAAASLTADQRGLTRLTGANVDIGAVETPLVVTIAVDENDGNYSINDLSLREAIALAAATSGFDEITFASSLSGSTITLSYDGADSGSFVDALLINTDVKISGLGANQLAISGNDQANVFQVVSGATATIRNLTITDGYASGGAGIINNGNLTLDRVEIKDGVATYGGAIYSAGPLFISNSTIAGNTASWLAGGLLIMSAPATIVNSTISSNLVPSSGGLGGGIYDATSGSQIVNSTITANWAAMGSGIYSSTGTALFNSIVAKNFNYNGTATTGDIYGAFNSASAYNLIGYDSNLSNGINNGTNNNQVGGQSGALAIDPKLTALGYYGGTTRTHALRWNSTAIDTGSNSLAAAYGLLLDERDFDRIIDWMENDAGPNVDIGAVELAFDEFYF